MCGKCAIISLVFCCLQNFHLMDYHLAIFITVMLARRLVWTIVSEVNTLTTSVALWTAGVQSHSYSLACPVQVSQSIGGSLVRYVVLITARLSLLTMCGCVLCWTLLNLCKNYSVLNLLFLGYP